MSTSGDAWAFGPAPKSDAPPPRPDVGGARPLAPAPAVSHSSFETAEGWKRVGAVLGVIWAFFFIFTIPGWIALGHYRKWKRNEIKTPYGLIWWGYIFGGLVVVSLLGSIASLS